MPVASYLAYPVMGQKDELVAFLELREDCSVVPSSNAELLILVTETEDWMADKALHRELQMCDALQCLVLVMGEVAGELAPTYPIGGPDELPLANIPDVEMHKRSRRHG